MRLLPGLVGLGLVPSLALAQSLVPGGTLMGIAAEDKDEPVAIRAEDCAQLIRHVPADDVAYVDGVDAAGNPVVPADLPGRFQPLADEEVVINIELGLGRKYGVPPRGYGRYDGIVAVGRVLLRDGRAYFNDQPMEAEDELVLAAACRRYGF